MTQDSPLNLAYRAQLYGDHGSVQTYAQQALQADPGNPYARLMLCQLLMMHTQFQQGREHYEIRFDAKGAQDATDWRHFPAPRWQGEPLQGKRLYLWTEQGVGDLVMFAAFLPYLLAQAPGNITFGTIPKIIPLLQRSFPAIVIESQDLSFAHAQAAILSRSPEAMAVLQAMGEPASQSHDGFDFAAPIGDLLVYAMPEFIPARRQSHYLLADMDRVASLRRDGEADKRRRIGISWHTNNALNGMVRSIPLAMLAPLLTLSNCRFFSLQHGVDDSEITSFNQTHGAAIQPPGFDPLQDIDALAALIASMDEVITIDNSNAHLAGALGVPTTLLLSKGCNFRWPEMEDGGSLWYRNMRILRQARALDWSPVIAQANRKLAARIG